MIAGVDGMRRKDDSYEYDAERFMLEQELGIPNEPGRCLKRRAFGSSCAMRLLGSVLYRAGRDTSRWTRCERAPTIPARGAYTTDPQERERATL